jgi:hypothetical protein
MLVFSVSDKGGTGRSVTSCNIAYHLAQRDDVAYLDFDFGSPTAGAIFEMKKVEKGIDGNGLHSYVEGKATEARTANVWETSNRTALRTSGTYAGRLTLYPGNRGGAEFSSSPDKVDRCVSLFQKLESEYAVTIVDLSAGRSHALMMALQATGQKPLKDNVKTRWLVFHRWTRQHIVAAHSLIYDGRGVLDIGTKAGHDRQKLVDAIRTVRTAVPDRDAGSEQLSALNTWLRTCDNELHKQAKELNLGPKQNLGDTPVEPVLQWREQIILDTDVAKKIANEATTEAFRELASKVINDAEWDRV